MNKIAPIVTNGIKVAGLAVGLISPHGAFSGHPESLILALGAFMMAGAQVSEKVIFGIIDRFLGIEKPDESAKQQATEHDG